MASGKLELQKMRKELPKSGKKVHRRELPQLFKMPEVPEIGELVKSQKTPFFCHYGGSRNPGKPRASGPRLSPG
jgi:hypothetical protein